MTNKSQESGKPLFPLASVGSDRSVRGVFERSTWWLWVMAFSSLIVAGFLSYRALGPRGPVIEVLFDEGFGIKPEDDVRFRGIVVGQVEDVALRDDLQGIDVKIRLHPDAASMARKGSQFWIERPQLSLARMSGLETVVGAKFVGVMPGPPDAELVTSFRGIEHPPQLKQASDLRIMIRFRDGHGIAPGNFVKFRGIEVGEVTDVRLDERLAGVEVWARLSESAAALATDGATYWIERPKINLVDGVRGLDTLVGGQYLAVIPGTGTEPVTEFVGLESPPPDILPHEDGLMLTLIAEERFGIERGAPLSYRGMDAGQVIGVELSPVGDKVHFHVVVHPQYADLVRSNTEFWSRSAVDMQLGLRGIDIDVDPKNMRSAVAFATPTPAGDIVTDGATFPLSDDDPDGWQDWKPIRTIGRAFRDSRPDPDAAQSTRPAVRILDRIRNTIDAIGDLSTEGESESGGTQNIDESSEAETKQP